MSDSLELLKSRARTTSQLPAVEDEDECAAFGFLRGARDRALNLELRFSSGNRLLLSYAWLGMVQFDPSHGILAKFVGDRIYLVLIEGSNLNSVLQDGITLFDRGLHSHRIIWVREMSRADQERLSRDETIIDHIRVVSYRHDEEPPNLEWLEPFREPGR